MRVSKTTAAAAALAIALTACAADSDVADEMSEIEDAMGDMASEAVDAMGDMASEAADAMGDMASEAMHDMDMGSSDAMRADEMSGGTLRSSDLVILDGAPAAFADATGMAHLALDEGSTLTIDVDGLPAGTAVVGHLHAESCATSGGPHFMFDPAGSDTPPNEVHIAATADDSGSFSVTVTNEMAATDAMSVVIHAADGDKTKAMCADLAA